MGLSADEIGFLDQHHSAAMITVGTGSTVKAVRVGVALVDGKLWSSGTSDRVRTRRLRENPQCTPVRFRQRIRLADAGDDGQHPRRPRRARAEPAAVPADAGKPSGPLQWFGGSLDEHEFLRRMSEEGRLIYEFDVHHSYGLH